MAEGGLSAVDERTTSDGGVSGDGDKTERLGHGAVTPPPYLDTYQGHNVISKNITCSKSNNHLGPVYFQGPISQRNVAEEGNTDHY